MMVAVDPPPGQASVPKIDVEDMSASAGAHHDGPLRGRANNDDAPTGKGIGHLGARRDVLQADKPRAPGQRAASPTVDQPGG